MSSLVKFYYEMFIPNRKHSSSKEIFKNKMYDKIGGAKT